ncbi:Card1-like endonuclease domain-containing protein [Dictyobacter arantiisoli]|uniref:DUF1887 domain-containing protein n=1 Tax=Dictyobacter arantiisoli TaxID=2014874 RepID=A0A5A5TFM5_9CHLR|nr:DUF1887 family CARF protein [Dictyobacter arantiisoli]GCF10222.1 hypothetical protein KDI_37860 [Dictyobacter arantiisoli]
MPKALLVLFGGRLIPNVLTMIHEKPDLLVAIVSESVTKGLPNFHKLVDTLSVEKKPLVDTSFVVNAFNVEEISSQCKNAVDAHPGYEWIFNITSGTAIMSIGAYEAAKILQHNGHSIKCWYIDTGNTNVVSLLDQEKPDTAMFDISVEQYIATYNCRLEPGNLGNLRKLAEEKWLPFALELVQHHENIDLLKQVIQEIQDENSRRKKEQKKREITKEPPMIINPQVYNVQTREAYSLLEAAYNVGILNKLSSKGSSITIDITPQQFNFLNGTWLEVYVWHEVKKLNRFTDCQWNQELYPLHEAPSPANLNELDVSMIHKAQMFFVECKAGKDAFSAKTLSTFDSVANTLGGNFVTKILVTSLAAKSDDHRTNIF